MKAKLQHWCKHAADAIALPFLLMFIGMYRLTTRQRSAAKRILLGMMSNNNLVYVRDALKTRGYSAKIMPWCIPAHEKNIIDYDLDLQARFPRLYANFFGQLLLLYGFFCYAIANFDIFIMPFQNRLLDRTGFLTKLELQLLRWARKTIILNPYGGDIQYTQVWASKKDAASQELYRARINDTLYSQISDSNILSNTQYCLNYAHAVILSIDWPDYLPTGDYHYLHMRCTPTLPTMINNKTSKPRPVRIVHATNHAAFKGTQHLIAACEAINQQGPVCELVILKNKPHTEIMHAIANADIVFDQILLGAYGRLAIEAMALSKPVLCYLRADFIELYPHWQQCPIINANIDTLEQKLRDFIQLPATQQQAIGQQSKQYVETFHSPAYVGQQLANIIEEVAA